MVKLGKPRPLAVSTKERGNYYMFQVMQPDYRVHILIKGRGVIGMEWGEILQHEPNITIKEVKKQLVGYLQQANKIVNKINSK
jgi:hypothetical protein